MKIGRFSFWPYALVSGLLSYAFFLIFGESFVESKESIIGFCGILIAGSWSYLSIETSKEIRMRDEIVKYINEYESSVLLFVDRSDVFFRSNYDFIAFSTNKKKLEDMIVENRRSCKEWEHLERRLKEDYSPRCKKVIYERLMDACNACVYQGTVTSLKGAYLKCYMFRDEKIDEVDDLAMKIISNMKETYGRENFESTDPRIYVKHSDLIKMQQLMFMVTLEKTKSFEARSDGYAEIKGFCLFIIFFSVFFSLWCYLNMGG